MTAAPWKDTGIIFQARLVRAILEDRKDQTRRLKGLDHLNRDPGRYAKPVPQNREKSVWIVTDTLDGNIPKALKCPYGGIGDRLWVRETFGVIHEHPDLEWERRLEDARRQMPWAGVVYRATETHYEGPWRPSIFMPRWASRISLDVAGVKLQRLDDMTDRDAIAEGIMRNRLSMAIGAGGESEKAKFFALWDEINAKTCPSDRNPWVWALTFKRRQAS